MRAELRQVFYHGFQNEVQQIKETTSTPLAKKRGHGQTYAPNENKKKRTDEEAREGKRQKVTQFT